MHRFKKKKKLLNQRDLLTKEIYLDVLKIKRMNKLGRKLRYEFNTAAWRFY